MATMEKPARFARFDYLGPATQPDVFQRVLEILEIIHLFDDFERKDILMLLEQMTCFRVAPDTPILYEEEPGDFMMLLLSGSVEIVKKDTYGIYQQLSIAGPGKVIGEMSLIDGEPRSAGCIARSETTFAMLDRRGLGKILMNEPAVGAKLLIVLMQISAGRLREVTRRLAHMMGAIGVDWV